MSVLSQKRKEILIGHQRYIRTHAKVEMYLMYYTINVFDIKTGIERN
jgi:hypothetical protein